MDLRNAANRAHPAEEDRRVFESVRKEVSRLVREHASGSDVAIAALGTLHLVGPDPRA